MSLTADERETTITWCDADDKVLIYTAQRPMLSALSKNPSAVLVEAGMSGTSAWARYEIPVGLVTIRKGRKSGAPRQLRQNVCGEVREDGTVCQGVAKKDTGKCRWHS